MRINNRGMIISGGTSKVGQVMVWSPGEMVVGADPAAARGDLSRQLEALIRLLEEKQAALPDGAYLVGDARRVAAEVAKPEPDKGKISSLLGMLAEGTKDLASIASTVGSVKALAAALFAIV